MSDDVKIAVKDGFDFIELDGMQGSTGAGSAEVIGFTGIRTDAPSCIAHIRDDLHSRRLP